MADINYIDLPEKTTPSVSGDKVLITDSEDGNLVKIQEALQFKGPQGEQGEQGIQGIQGEQGIQGIQGETGPAGADGLDITWLGAYNPATSYVINDAVSYNGSSYICKLASTGNLPTNATYFDLMAQKGDDGAGSGDVVGPVSSTNNNIVVFDGTTGKLIKDSGLTLSGTNTGDETTTRIGALIGGADNATPNDTDFIATSLTAGGILKKLTWTNAKAFLKTYFDTLYVALTGNQTIAGIKTFTSKVNVTYGEGIYNNTVTTNPLIKSDYDFAGTGFGDSTRITPGGNLVTTNAVYSANNRNGSIGNFHIAGQLETTGVIQLGHASDTTLSRVSAGIIAIEGKTVATTDGTVNLTGDQTIAGIKTFSSSPIVPTPTTDMQVATKKYVDDNAGGGGGTKIRAFIPADQSVTSSTETLLNFTSESFDTLSEFNTTNKEFIAGVTGTYNIHMQISLSNPTDNIPYQLIVRKNGLLLMHSNTSGSGTSRQTISISDFVQLTAGDNIKFYLTPGANVTIDGVVRYSFLNIFRVF